MKYVELIKSIILTFLVLLSVSLTMIIWSYEPEYEFLEEPEVQQMAIGTEKELRDIIRPYKALYRQDNELHGSVSVVALEQSMDLLTAMDIGNIRIAKENATPQSMNKLMNEDNQIMLLFNTDVPLETLNEALKLNQNDIENMQFDRIIINTQNLRATQAIELRFINTKANVIYRAAATVDNVKELNENIKAQMENAFEYEEFTRDGELSYYLPHHNTDAFQFTYFTDETQQELLTGALFTDSPILQKNVEGNLEKYDDGMSLMTFDTSLKIMDYENPSAENSTIIAPGKLVNDTFNSINDHGGFNADFRLSSVDHVQKSAEFQLFFQGYPVYSTTTLTRIVTTWGDNRLVRYRRPYYELQTDITTVKTSQQLANGQQVIEQLDNQIANTNSIDDLVIGYFLIQDQNTRLFVLEPSWFAMSGNSWTRITLLPEGSVADGLE